LFRGAASFSELAMTEADRRKSPRYAFIATAELLEPATDVRIASRVSELSVHGCYLDMMNPFPVGTMTLVKIWAGDAVFQSKSKVLYATPNMGAGVVFLETDPQAMEILTGWIRELAMEPGRVLT
jgi:PilZ domain-containing protein